MHRIINHKWLAAGLLPLICAAALGQDPIHEDFESYSPGPLNGQGHWVVNGPGATTVGPATGPNGNLTQIIDQSPGADSACAFADVTTMPIEDGRWQITISILVESNFMGESQISIANQLGAPAPDDWYLFVRLNGNDGLLYCDCGSSTVSVPLVVDEWATLRVIVDLPTASTGDVLVSVYYDEQLVRSFFTLPLLNAELGGIQLTTRPGGNPAARVSFDNLEVIPFNPSEPGLPRCFGAAAVTACPCGNDVPRAAGSGCENSTMTGATLFAGGSASLFAADLELKVTGSVPFQPSVFIQGEEAIGGGFGIPFGDGLRCCGTNVLRVETVFPNGAGDAAITIDGAALGASPGDFRCFQFWYRDPFGACGSGFNLSNSYEIFWQP